MKSGLWAYNITLCILHLCLAIGFTFYFTSLNKKYPNDPVDGMDITIRRHTLTYRPDRQSLWSSDAVVTPRIETIQVLMVIFFLITSFFHAVYAVTDQGLYTRMITRQNNYLRWVEYSITSTIMLYIIALISGVKDEGVFILIGATNVAMIAQGHLIEQCVADKKPWVVPMMVGFLLLFSEFTVITKDFENRIHDVESSPLQGKMPRWIKYMIIVLFMFYSVFGFVSLYGAYSRVSYENIEKSYLLLSFVSKAVLGAFVAYGTGQRQKAEAKTPRAGQSTA